MSWLKPGNIPDSGHDAERSVDRMAQKHGRLGAGILDAFNQSDPLHVFFGENSDEYLGYVDRFMQQLGDRDFQKLSDEEIAELVRRSFHKSQIEKGFADPKDLEELTHRIIQLKKLNSSSAES